MSPRIWYSEPDFERPSGLLLLAALFIVVLRENDGVACSELLFMADGPLEYLRFLDGYCGRGVVSESDIEGLDLGIRIDGAGAACIEWSDVGGDGGVGVSDTVEEADFVGGVAIVGEDIVVGSERSDIAV